MFHNSKSSQLLGTGQDASNAYKVATNFSSPSSITDTIADENHAALPAREEFLIGPAFQVSSGIEDAKEMSLDSLAGSVPRDLVSGESQHSRLRENCSGIEYYRKVSRRMPSNWKNYVDLRTDFTRLKDDYDSLVDLLEKQLQNNYDLTGRFDIQEGELHNLKKQHGKVEGDLQHTLQRNAELHSLNTGLQEELDRFQKSLPRNGQLQDEADGHTQLKPEREVLVDDSLLEQIADLRCTNAELHKELELERARMNECTATIHDYTDFLQRNLELTDLLSLQHLNQSPSIFATLQPPGKLLKPDVMTNTMNQHRFGSDTAFGEGYNGPVSKGSFADSNITEDISSEQNSRASSRGIPHDLGFLERRSTTSSLQSARFSSRSVRQQRIHSGHVRSASETFDRSRSNTLSRRSIIAAHNEASASGSLTEEWVNDQNTSRTPENGTIHDGSSESPFISTRTQYDQHQNGTSNISTSSEENSQLQGANLLKTMPKNAVNGRLGSSTDGSIGKAAGVGLVASETRSDTNSNSIGSQTTVTSVIQQPRSHSDSFSGSSPQTPHESESVDQARIIGSPPIMSSGWGLDDVQDKPTDEIHKELSDIHKRNSHQRPNPVLTTLVFSKNPIEDDIPLSSTKTIDTLGTLGTPGTLIDKTVNWWNSIGTSESLEGEKTENANSVNEPVDDNQNSNLVEESETHWDSDYASSVPNQSDDSISPTNSDSSMYEISKDATSGNPIVIDSDRSRGIELWTIFEYLAAYWSIILNVFDPVSLLMALSDYIEMMVDMLLAVPIGELSSMVLASVGLFVSKTQNVFKRISHRGDWWLWINLAMAVYCLWATIVTPKHHQDWYTANTSTMRKTIMDWREDYWDHRVLQYLRWYLEVAIERQSSRGNYLMVT